MALRDIVVLLDGSARDAAKLAVAQQLAQQHDAHLTGFCALERLLPPDMSFALGGYPDLWAMPEFARQIDEQARGKAAVIEAGFREMLFGDGLDLVGGLFQQVEAGQVDGGRGGRMKLEFRRDETADRRAATGMDGVGLRRGRGRGWWR